MRTVRPENAFRKRIPLPWLPARVPVGVPILVKWTFSTVSPELAPLAQMPPFIAPALLSVRFLKVTPLALRVKTGWMEFVEALTVVEAGPAPWMVRLALVMVLTSV